MSPEKSSGRRKFFWEVFLMTNSSPTDRLEKHEQRRSNGRLSWVALVGLLFALSLLPLSGCSGGGEDGTPGGSVGTGVGTAAVSWDAPTTNADGTPLADLAGFKIYYGTTSPLNKDTSLSVDVGDSTSYTLTGLNTGTYYFSAAAYDTAGNESDLSEELSETVTGT